MKVTVVIPAYNAERHLEEAVKSVLGQTHDDFELIVVNDGSQDHTLAILNELARTDRRIKVIDQDNRGTAGALNRGLEEAETEWVVVMHADDLMLPERLERQIAFIRKNPDLKVSSCLAYYISETGKQLGKTKADLFSREKFQWYVDHHETIGLLHPGAVLHRDTVMNLGGYRQPFWPAEDIDLWNRVAEKGHLILVQNEVLMKYRIHTGSVSTARFAATRLKYEWVRRCMQSRRGGQPELDWEAFQQEWNSAPVLQRLNRSRKTQAKAFYHAAGHDYLRGQVVKGALKLSMAALLQPDYVLPRLRSQMVK